MNYNNIKNIFKYIEFDDETLICDIIKKSLYVEEIKNNKLTNKFFNQNIIYNENKIFVCDEYQIKVICNKTKKAVNKIYEELRKKKIINIDEPIIITIHIENDNLKKYHYECSRIKLKEENFINNKKFTHANLIKRYFNK